MSTNEMTGKVKELKELKLLAESIAAEAADIEDSIKAEMTARGVDELIIGEYKIRWKAITSTRIDTTALKKELPELAERYSKRTTTKRFTIA